MEDRTAQAEQPQLKALFEAALDLPADARALFLQTQTTDAELLASVHVARCAYW